MATHEFSNLMREAAFGFSAVVPRHSIRLTELVAESRRLRKEFLRSSIQVSLTMASIADAGLQDDAFQGSCRRAAQKGYGKICAMISTPAFAQMDLSELLPSLRELEMVLGDAGGSHICPIPVSEPVQKEAPIAAGAKLKSLTPRETQVLRLIAEGNSTKEIAHLLGMSFKTAACHRYRVMDKLEIHDAVSLTRFAVRAGLVTL